MAGNVVPCNKRGVPTSPPPYGRLGGKGGGTGLFEQRCDRMGEAVSSPIQAAFDGAEVAARYIGDLRIALSFELTQHEDGPVVDRELSHALLDRFLEIPFT